MTMKSSKKGFTLIELLAVGTVIAIIGFLTNNNCGGGSSENSSDFTDAEEFMKGPGYKIMQAIKELESAKETLKESITKVESTLTLKGRDPRNDFDLALWKHELEELERAIQSLRYKYDNAEVAFIKAKYSPNSSLEHLMKRAVEEGNEASEEAIKKYRAIMRGMRTT